jgi:DNA-binding MarR family transcriptional regulator
MNETKQLSLPIGYWLKRADEVLTTHIDDAQRINGLSRIDWQLLNTLRERGPASREQVAESLRPFTDAAAVLNRLAGRGLVVESDGLEYRLTDDGHTLHERALALQREVRRRAVEGIGESDYATTVQVLQRLVENLERR